MNFFEDSTSALASLLHAPRKPSQWQAHNKDPCFCWHYMYLAFHAGEAFENKQRNGLLHSNVDHGPRRQPIGGQRASLPYQQGRQTKMKNCGALLCRGAWSSTQDAKGLLQMPADLDLDIDIEQQARAVPRLPSLPRLRITWPSWPFQVRSWNKESV